MKISKSKFIAGVQCLKRLYLLVHSRELAAQPDGSDQAIIEQGREVGLLARQLFPGGVEVDGSGGLKAAICATRELVNNPDVPAIFEAAFDSNDVVVKTDILQRRKENLWRLVEVKSTTDLKDHHSEDVAIQSYVLSLSGLKLASVWLAHVNRSYVLTGATVDPHQFFLFRNLTTRTQNLQPELKLRLREQFRILAASKPPDIPTGTHCINPVVCEFFHHCNHPRPDDYIGCLPRLNASAIEQLEKMGIESVHDIPADFELSNFQRRACTAIQTGQPLFSEDLKTEFESLRYPLHFMDFETVNPAIPRFPGMRPYSHLPFQWSVHIQREGERRATLVRAVGATGKNAGSNGKDGGSGRMTGSRKVEMAPARAETQGAERMGRSGRSSGTRRPTRSASTIDPLSWRTPIPNLRFQHTSPTTTSARFRQ